MPEGGCFIAPHLRVQNVPTAVVVIPPMSVLGRSLILQKANLANRRLAWNRIRMGAQAAWITGTFRIRFPS